MSLDLPDVVGPVLVSHKLDLGRDGVQAAGKNYDRIQFGFGQAAEVQGADSQVGPDLLPPGDV